MSQPFAGLTLGKRDRVIKALTGRYYRPTTSIRNPSTTTERPCMQRKQVKAEDIVWKMFYRQNGLSREQFSLVKSC